MSGSYAFHFGSLNILVLSLDVESFVRKDTEMTILAFGRDLFNDDGIFTGFGNK